MAKAPGKRVAILTENGFEEIELTSPKRQWKKPEFSGYCIPAKK